MQSFLKSGIFVAVFLLSCQTSFANSSVEDDLSMTSEQKEVLDKFRKRVLHHLPQDYMKEDIYLIRWLRVKNFNLDAAERMLLKSLAWRQTNNMDKIDEEDWSYFERGYAYSVDTNDKKGQPLIIISNVIPWNIRSTILQGKRDQLVRWMAKMFEDASKRVRSLQAEGKNTTRFSMINTLDNFNIVESGCLQCLSVFTTFTSNYEENYPEMMDQMVLVNVPGIFDAVLTLIRPLMTPGTRKAMRLMGTNKKVWQAELLKEIDPDQLPIDLGGNREDI